MRALALLAVLALLAGCAAPKPAPAPANATNATAVAPMDYSPSNATVPQAEIQNATLGESHVHDLWKGREQIVLLDAEVAAGLCEGPADAALFLAQELVEHQGAADGCARLSIPEGVVVPEGTGDLEVSVDASDALKGGAMELNFRDKAREGYGDPTTNPVHAWHLNLTQADWDLPHANATTWIIYVQAHGDPAGLMDGNVKARVVAHRIPGWQPILAVAHVDHWKLPHLHDFPAPDVMRLYDGPANVTNIDPARFQGQDIPEPIKLKDIIAPDTKHVTLVVDRKTNGCPAPMECWLVPALVVGGYERERFGNLTFAEGERRVYTWSVPGEVPEDSVYANASTTMIDPRIEGCPPGGDESTCGITSIASTTVTARILVLAWHGDVDVAKLKAIADAK